MPDRAKVTGFRFKPIDAPRPSQFVARRIAEAVHLGDIAVGHKLPSEQKLAAQLEVTRAVIREALKILSGAGIIQIVPGAAGGSFVVAQNVAADLLGPLPSELHLGDLVDVLYARRIIEPPILELAAARADDADFGALRAALESSRAAAPFTEAEATDVQVEALSLAAIRFNIALGRATHNAVFADIMDKLTRAVQPLRLLAIRATPSAAHETLEATLSAVEAGDAAAIKSAITERLDYLEAAWERAAGRRLWRLSASPSPLSASSSPSRIGGAG